ncbi:trehalose 6-phosphate phosphatase [Roseibium aquae]|uniref:Trehalose 6-phosphate phosphatase n=1 Tax=Roseibium aquae TaxID=1323746 RepID=A0A916TMY0_9HYPH|nr:trehalose-phosphatase [Roseibium aquae]GGB60851.1 trehalose 6-phosphate phosphatase [Roseibium aquae]
METPPHVRPDMALFLDFDGTLVDLAPRPEQVAVSPGVVDTLSRLQVCLDGAVAVISGRPIAEIDHFLDPLQLPAAGLHGLEHRKAVGADIIRDKPTGAIAQLKADLEASDLLTNGVFLENKGVALAVHYRANPDREEDVRGVMQEAVAGLDNLHLVEGKMVIEAKPATSDKGRAVEAFMAHAPFKDRTPVFIGDDVTDEDGLAAAQRLGGLGVKVGMGQTCAHYRLSSVPAVHAWLTSNFLALEH